MSEENRLDRGKNASGLEEEQIARLLAELPPAPPGWAQAAKELPAARAAIDGIVERAGADARYRRQVLAGLEAALEQEGHAPRASLLAALRARLAPGPDD